MLNEELVVGEKTIMCAFGYAVGRKSLTVAPIVRDIINNIDELSQPTRLKMIEVISEKYHMNALGHPYDRDQWVNLLNQLQELENGNKLL